MSKRPPCPECGQAHDWAEPKTRYHRLHLHPHGNWSTEDATVEVEELRAEMAALRDERRILLAETMKRERHRADADNEALRYQWQMEHDTLVEARALLARLEECASEVIDSRGEHEAVEMCVRALTDARAFLQGNATESSTAR